MRTLKLPGGGVIHLTYERLGARHTTTLTLASELHSYSLVVR